MFVYFPALHPALAPADLPPGTRLVDPGYEDSAPGKEAGAGVLRPEGLPLEPAAARSLVQESVSYGEQFRSPGDLAAVSLQEALKDESESGPNLTAELARRIAGNAGPDPERRSAAQAQMVLLLAWFYEERLLELSGLERGLSATWRRFGESLGLAGGDGETEERELVKGVGSFETLAGYSGLPWALVLEALARFLPADAALLTAEREPLETWRDMGLALVPATDAGLPAGSLAVTAPVWKLSGRRRAPEGRPELLRELRAVSLPPVPSSGAGEGV